MAQEEFNPLDPYSELPALTVPETDLGAYMPAPTTTKRSAAIENQNLSYAYDYLLKQGFKPHQAAGIVGNLAQESGGRTDVKGDTNLPGGSLGLGQWNRERLYGGGGYTGLLPFSKERGLDPQNLYTQLDYMMHELKGPERKALEGVLASRNVDEAARIFGEAYERPNAKYANYENRIAQAKQFLGNSPTETQGPQGETYDIPLSNGQTLHAPVGVPREEAIANLRASGLDVEGLTSHKLTSGQTLHIPDSVNIADALANLQKQHPDQEWMTEEHAAKTGFMPAAKAAVLGLGPMAQQGAGEILQEFDATKNLGDEWRAQALKKREEINKGVEETLSTDPLRTRIAHGAGSIMGGAVPAVALTPLAMMGPVGAGAAALAGIPLAAGSLGQRYAEQKTPRDMDLSDPSNLAVVGAEALGQALPIAANPVGKSLLQNIGRGVASNMAVDVPSVALERAAVGQDVLSEEAAKEYLMAAAGDIVGGGAAGAGAHYFANRGRPPAKGEIPGEVPSELPPEQAALSESLAPKEGPAESVEDLEAQARVEEELFKKAQEAAPKAEIPEEEIPEPTVRGREQAVPPVGEMPPEEVIPEDPPVEAPPEPHFAQSILGLKPNGALSKRLAQYDLNNLEHHGAIEEEINKSSTNIPAEKLNALETRMKEITDASPIQKPIPRDDFSRKGPQGGEEVRYPTEGGEGVRVRDQEGQRIAGEGKGKEEVTPLSREEFAQRMGAEAPATGKLKTVHNPELAKATKAGDAISAIDALSKSSNPVIAHIGEKAKIADIQRVFADDSRLEHAVNAAKIKGTPVPKNVAGMYRGALGDILVKERHAGNEHVVAHEVAHAIVQDAVDAPTPAQLPHVNALKSLHKYVKNLPEFRNLVLKPNKKTGIVTPKIKKEYGVSDVQEFIAEGLSNPDFQHRLSQVKYQNTTAWGRFTDAVAKILGLKNDNAFAEFLAHTEQLIDKTQPTREVAEPKVKFAEEEEPEHQRYSDEAIDFANKQNWFERFYTPLRQGLVSAKAPLESLLSKLPLYDENNEIRSAVKLAHATRNTQIISNGLENGFLHRNARGVIEAVFDPRLAPDNLRKRMMELPEEARSKFAEAMTTLAQAGHNLRGAEMKAVMDDAQQKIRIGQAYLDKIATNYEKTKGKLEAAQELSRKMGTPQAKEMVAKAKNDLATAKAAYDSPEYAAGKKHVAAQQRLLKAVRDQFHKAKRDESGKIYDISKAQEQAAKDFLNSSPEVKRLASDVRELLTNNAELLRDSQVISNETYKKFTDDKYNYAPLYMSIEDLDTALPASRLYMQGEQRKVMTVKGLKGSQHEVNFFQNLLTHQARVGAMALHNNARLGALNDLEILGHAKELPGNATPTIKQQAIAVMKDGKRHYYLVQDRPLYEAFEINHNLPLPEYFTDVTRAFSKLQLVNPKYWYNQILREPFMATMTSRAGIITPAHAGKELASLVFSAITKQNTSAAEFYRDLKSQGVTGSHEYLRDLVKEKGKLAEDSGVKAVAKNATDLASTIHEYVDAATKVAVMRKAIEKAKSGKLTGTPILDEAAARDAAIAHVGDMLNFQNRGHNSTAKFIVQTTPFFNSWAQGMDSLVRNATGYGMSEHEAKQARQMFVAHAAALMAFSAAVTAFRCMYSEDYRNAKPDDWAANWLIPMPEEMQDKEGRMFKAKAPFELSTLFKLGPEIAVRRAFGLDHGKDTGKIISDSAWRDLAPPGAEAGFTPFLIKGALEAASGREIDIRSLLSGKESRKLWNADIVPMLRGKGESPIADALAFGDLSPAAVRHLGQSYFGEMFTGIDAVAKGVASTFGSKTARADLRDITEKVPWVNALVTNPDKLDMSTGYDFAEEQAMNRDSLRYAKKHGIELTPEETKELKESGRYGKQATRLKDNIAKINKAMDNLKNDPNYTDAKEAEYTAKNQRLQERKKKQLGKLEELRSKAEE